MRHSVSLSFVCPHGVCDEGKICAPTVHVVLATDRVAAFQADKNTDGVAITADARGLLTEEHWSVDSHRNGGAQLTHQLEEVCGKGNDMQKSRRTKNVVT